MHGLLNWIGFFSAFIQPVFADTITDAQRLQADQKIVGHFNELERYSKIAYRCIECHPNQTLLVEQSVHGKAGLLQKYPAGSICLTCHEYNHEMLDADKMKKFDLPAVTKKDNDLSCMHCHGDTEIAKIFGFSVHVPSQFESSMHYRKAKLGDQKAPLCQNCHGSHSILRVIDVNSPLHNMEQRSKVCGRCHQGANQNFAETFDHMPITWVGKPLEFAVISAFKILTLCTFMALGFFILLDGLSLLRQVFFKRARVPKPHVKGHIQRLDFHLRLQHFLMFSSVIVLILTAWPLLGAESEAAKSFVKILGGARSAAMIHRIAGIIMVGDFVYHIVYLYSLLRRGHKKFPMLPVLKDLRDLIGMFAYFFGIKKHKPEFDQFAFYEKFDYWAVFWGVAMMGGSGFVLMFPIWFTHIAPSWVVKLASIIHADEALLAGVVLIIWHFYNVHLKPGIFPMNWAWLTGKMPAHQYQEEHAHHAKVLKEQGKWPKDQD